MKDNSIQVLFQDIVSFLFQSPEWIKGWPNTLVKKKPSIDISDFVISFFNTLSLENFDTSLKLNRNWYKECKRELQVRRNICIKRYWNTIEKYKEAKKALDNCWEKGILSPDSQIIQCNHKYVGLANKKAEDFRA